MRQAVVKIGSSQYLIRPGQELLVDRPEIDAVLLATDDSRVLVGQPTLSDVHVSVELLDRVKGDKVRTAKYKAKSRYRKVRGFRPLYHKIKIGQIDIREK